MEPTVESGTGPASGTKPALGPVVQIDGVRIQTHLDEVVRSTVEETLNALLDAEADHLCGARLLPSGTSAATKSTVIRSQLTTLSPQQSGHWPNHLRPH
jgi:hypothetical protein